MSTIGSNERLLMEEVASSLLSAQSKNRTGIGHRFNVVLTALEMLADAMAAASGVAITDWLYQVLRLGKQVHYDWRDILGAGFVFACILVLLLDRMGAYRRGISLLRIRETERCLKASVTAILWCLPLTFLWGTLFSRWVFIIGMIVIPMLLVCEKQLACILVQGLHRHGYGLKKVLIYGAGYTGRRMLSAIARSPKLGLTPIALVDDDPVMAGQSMYASDYRRGTPVPVVSGPITEELLRKAGAEMVVVGIPTLDPDKFSQTLEQCAMANISCCFVSGQAFGSELLKEYIEVDGLMLHSFARPTMRREYETAKRALDLLMAAATVVLISPVLLVLAVLVKLDSKGPVFFRQSRVGKNGKLFTMFKYRTMYVDSCGDSYSPTDQEDPRITPIGRFLRRTSADELPQIFNVLRGDMALVGPRPEMPFIVAEYGLRERQRLQVIPGITGLWQLSADRSLQIHENIHYDLYYIRYRSLFLDIAILLHTIVFAMRGI